MARNYNKSLMAFCPNFRCGRLFTIMSSNISPYSVLTRLSLSLSFSLLCVLSKHRIHIHYHQNLVNHCSNIRVTVAFETRLCSYDESIIIISILRYLCENPVARINSMAPTLESDVAILGLSESAPMCLKKVISTRQFIFMALGSSIGAGLLLSTGQGRYPRRIERPSPLQCLISGGEKSP